MPTLLENKGVFSPVINDSKILPRNYSGIPLPVSDMIILQNEYPSISIRFILKITFPFGDVYLNALDNKLRIAELIFSTSIHSKSGSFSDSTVKFCQFMKRIGYLLCQYHYIDFRNPEFNHTCFNLLHIKQMIDQCLQRGSIAIHGSQFSIDGV